MIFNFIYSLAFLCTGRLTYLHAISTAVCKKPATGTVVNKPATVQQGLWKTSALMEDGAILVLCMLATEWYSLQKTETLSILI